VHAEGRRQERNQRQRGQRSAGELSELAEHRWDICRTIRRLSSDDRSRRTTVDGSGVVATDRENQKGGRLA
jgi:hypothetical protein